MLAFSRTGLAYVSSLGADHFSSSASGNHWSDAPPLINRIVLISVAYSSVFVRLLSFFLISTALLALN